MPITGFRIDVQQSYDNPATLTVYTFENANWHSRQTVHNLTADDLRFITAPLDTLAPAANLDGAVESIVQLVLEKQERKIEQALEAVQAARQAARNYRETV